MFAKVTAIAGLAIAAFGSTFAHAGEELKNLPAPIQMAVQGGLKVESTFEAKGGLTGWVLSEGPGRNIIVFSTKDGEAAIAGSMVDGKGQNLTAKYLEEYAPKIDYAKFWSRLESSSFVAEGAKGKDVVSTIYVFMDPNCGYCHAAWKAYKPYEAAGLQVRWVPVAFLGKDSPNKAAALLTSKTPEKTMDELHAKFGKATPMSTTVVTPEAKAKLEANGKLMAEMGFRGTPATIYKSKDGKVQTQDGMPRPEMMQAITGISLPVEAAKPTK